MMSDTTTDALEPRDRRRQSPSLGRGWVREIVAAVALEALEAEGKARLRDVGAQQHGSGESVSYTLVKMEGT